jgi:pimeloyl-ACP methyl ester carboxylesterase
MTTAPDDGASGARARRDPASAPRDPIFLLCSARSGSTLLRAMLAGHPELFAPPELMLLSFDSLDQRHRALAHLGLDAGLVRAAMELWREDQAAAETRVESWREAGYTTERALRELVARAAPRRLVEKSPATATELAALDRARRWFPRAFYLLLVRRPEAVIESFVRMRMQRRFDARGADEPWQVAEAHWRAAYGNATEFLAALPDSHKLVVRYEDLVASPEETARIILARMGLDYDPAVLSPYGGGRMTDGVAGPGSPIGDPNFHLRSAIEPALSDAWRQSAPARALSPETAALASELGYRPRPRRAPAAAPIEASRERIAAVGPLRLSLLEWGDERPAAGAPAFLCVHGSRGHALEWQPLAVQLAGRGHRVAALDLPGHGHSDPLPGTTGYSVAELVRCIDGALGAVGPRVVLVGHSLGGLLGLALAAARPEALRGLVLVDTPLVAIDGELGSAASLRAQLDPDSPAHPVLASRAVAVERLRRGNPALSEELAAAIARRALRQVDGGVTWSCDPRLLLPLVGREFLSATRHHLSVLAGARLPLLAAFGRESPLSTIRCRDLLRSAADRARVVELDTGHFPHIEAPGALADFVDEWLRPAQPAGSPGEVIAVLP